MEILWRIILAVCFPIGLVFGIAAVAAWQEERTHRNERTFDQWLAAWDETVAAQKRVKGLVWKPGVKKT